MKLNSLFSAAAFLALGVFFFAAFFSTDATGCYAACATLLIALGAIREYSPRPARWEPGQARAVSFRGESVAAHRLAA